MQEHGKPKRSAASQLDCVPTHHLPNGDLPRDLRAHHYFGVSTRHKSQSSILPSLALIHAKDRQMLGFLQPVTGTASPVVLAVLVNVSDAASRFTVRIGAIEAYFR